MEFPFEFGSKTVYLVDSENLNDAWVGAIENLGPKDLIYVFYTENSANMSLVRISELSARENQVIWKRCFTGTNALDFQLVSQLGALIARHPKDTFVILSNDTGYDPVVQYWIVEGIKISRTPVQTGTPRPRRTSRGLRFSSRNQNRGGTLSYLNGAKKETADRNGQSQRTPASQKSAQETKSAGKRSSAGSNASAKPKTAAPSRAESKFAEKGAGGSSGLKTVPGTGSAKSSPEKKTSAAERPASGQKSGLRIVSGGQYLNRTAKADASEEAVSETPRKSGKASEKGFSADAEPASNSANAEMELKRKASDTEKKDKDKSEKSGKAPKTEKAQKADKDKSESSDKKKKKDKKDKKEKDKEAKKAQKTDTDSGSKQGLEKPRVEAEPEQEPGNGLSPAILEDGTLSDRARACVEQLAGAIPQNAMGDYHEALVHLMGSEEGGAVYQAMRRDKTWMDSLSGAWKEVKEDRINTFIGAYLSYLGAPEEDAEPIREIILEGSSANYAGLYRTFVHVFGAARGRAYYNLFKGSLRTIQQL